MAENNPNTPTPPKPAEASKVQPKKETVRISLPPKPAGAPAAAKQTVRLNLPPKPATPPAASPGSSMPSSAPSINLIVPQVQEVDTSVKIPNAAEVQTAAAHGAKPAAPVAPGASMLEATKKAGGHPAAPAASPAGKAAEADKKAVKAPVPATGPRTVKASKADMALAVVAAIVGVLVAVRVFMLTLPS
jgi:hypothetical protein